MCKHIWIYGLFIHLGCIYLYIERSMAYINERINLIYELYIYISKPYMFLYHIYGHIHGLFIHFYICTSNLLLAERWNQELLSDVKMGIQLWGQTRVNKVSILMVSCKRPLGWFGKTLFRNVESVTSWQNCSSWLYFLF